MESLTSIPQKLSKFIFPGKVFIFSTSYCPYCDKAKNLFKKLNVEFKSVEVDRDSQFDDHFITTLENHSKIDTYPKIYIGTSCVGGFTDLNKLLKDGKLFPMLKTQGIGYSEDAKF